MTEAEYRAVLKTAGVADHEIRVDPVHGIVVTASGLSKLCRIAPPGPARDAMTAMATQVRRKQIKPVTAS